MIDVTIDLRRFATSVVVAALCAGKSEQSSKIHGARRH